MNEAVRVAVALGSNVGNRAAHLRAARVAINGIAGVAPPIHASSMYETEPVDCEPGAAAFLNAVIECSFHGEPMRLFRELKRIEGELGRPADHARNVSRSIDLDLLYFGDMVVRNESLSIPHPRIAQRRFVLAPLAEIHPDLILADQSRTVTELLASLGQSTKVQRLTSDWGPA